MKACYLIDVCDPNGDMIDNLEISKATAMRLLEVIDLGPLREHARLFNAALCPPGSPLPASRG